MARLKASWQMCTFAVVIHVFVASSPINFQGSTCIIQPSIRPHLLDLHMHHLEILLGTKMCSLMSSIFHFRYDIYAFKIRYLMSLTGPLCGENKLASQPTILFYVL